MFTHLHCHTGVGSILDSTITPSEYPKRAKELGMDAVAITDHGYLIANLEFYLECQKQNIKPILGCEMYVTESMDIKQSGTSKFHLILLAKDNNGYKNLQELCTRARLDGFYGKPRIDFNLLSQYSEGLICSSACLGGELPKMIMNNKDNRELEEYIYQYKKIFGDDFYLELQSADNETQEEVNKKLLDLSVKTNTEVIITSDTHFLYKEDYDLHSMFIGINQDRDNEVYKDCWFKNEHEIKEVLLKYIDEEIIDKAFENTQKIANKCNVELDLGHSYLPDAILPEGFDNEEDYIWKLIEDGMNQKGLYDKDEYWDRVETEMEVISKKGFIGYFLILADLICECKNEGIPIAPARGSAGGSLVSYLLRITEIDPIKYGLSFGRFLTMERMSPPDIDSDFATSCRYKAIHKVREKYGAKNVAQVMTYTNMQAKAILDAVGKQMNIEKNDIELVKKMIVDGKLIKDTLLDNDKVPQHLRHYVYYCSRLEGLPRSTSLHAGGVVICPQGHVMSDYGALMLSKEGEITIQHTKETVELAGLVKYDFLATTVMDIINDTIESVGEKYYEFNFDFEDEKVWDYICSGDSSACFQIESNFMTEILLKVKPRSIEELCAVISLGRPDTMGEVNTYVARKEGKEKPTYYDEMLKPLLEKTYGTMIYQETFMEIAKVYAHYTDGEADKLRKGLGKKDKALVKQEADKFYHRAIEAGRDEKVARELADIFMDKGGYCFNKSHGIAYAIVCYMCCYLKYYHLVEFMTSVVNNQKNQNNGAIDFDGVSKYLKAAKDDGIKITPPDINISGHKFTPNVDDNSIAYGLDLVKGLSSNACKVIIENRPYSSYKDFVERVSLLIKKNDMNALIKCGAFSNLTDRDKTYQAKLYFSKRFDNGKEKKKPINKINKTHIKFLLDEGLITPEQQDDKELCLKKFNLDRKSKAWVEFKEQYFNGTEAEYEMETLNAHLTIDPFEGVVIPDWNAVSVDNYGYIGGVIVSVKETTVKSGKSAGQKMAFINVDFNGKTADIVVFSNKYREYNDLLKTGRCVVCTVEKQGDLNGILHSCVTLNDYLEATKKIQKGGKQHG